VPEQVQGSRMNYIDIVLAILLLTGLIRGFLKGFIFEIAILGCFFLGSYAAFHFAYLLQPYLLKIGKMNGHTVAYVSSFLMFLIISVGIFFLAKLFTGLVNIAALGIFNKILGGLFGLLKYAFIISIVLYFFNQLDSKHHYLSPDRKAESHLYYPILKMSPALLPVLNDLKKNVTEKISS
jgi:membrane protein required for colicin V production